MQQHARELRSEIRHQLQRDRVIRQRIGLGFRRQQRAQRAPEIGEVLFHARREDSAKQLARSLSFRLRRRVFALLVVRARHAQSAEQTLARVRRGEIALQRQPQRVQIVRLGSNR